MQNLLEVLTDMRDGAVLLDCNEKFSAMVTGVLETGRAGEMTLKFKVTPSKISMKSNEGVLEVEIAHEINSKVPELPVGKSTFFVHTDGRLSRHNEKQDELFRERRVNV